MQARKPTSAPIPIAKARARRINNRSPTPLSNTKLLTQILEEGAAFRLAHPNAIEEDPVCKIADWQILLDRVVFSRAYLLTGPCFEVITQDTQYVIDQVQSLSVARTRNNMPNEQWPEPTVDEPDEEQLEAWVLDSVCEATDGCTVEPDGVCQHGHPSWLLRLELI